MLVYFESLFCVGLRNNGISFNFCSIYEVGIVFCCYLLKMLRSITRHITVMFCVPKFPEMVLHLS